MKWLVRFLGIDDKKQKERTIKVSKYVHNQKNVFATEMINLQKQAKKVHKTTKKSHRESVKLLEVVDDLTVKMARAQGGTF